MRGLRTDTTAQLVIAGHAFMQNLRRGCYELAVNAPPATRVAAAFIELARGDLTADPYGFNASTDPTTQRRSKSRG